MSKYFGRWLYSVGSTLWCTSNAPRFKDRNTDQNLDSLNLCGDKIYFDVCLPNSICQKPARRSFFLSVTQLNLYYLFFFQVCALPPGSVQRQRSLRSDQIQEAVPVRRNRGRGNKISLRSLDDLSWCGGNAECHLVNKHSKHFGVQHVVSLFNNRNKYWTVHLKITWNFDVAFTDWCVCSSTRSIILVSCFVSGELVLWSVCLQAGWSDICLLQDSSRKVCEISQVKMFVLASTWCWRCISHLSDLVLTVITVC